MDELLDAIWKSQDSPVGPDDIHYQMIKHPSSGALHILLNILNNIWTNGSFFASWHQASVVPLLKAAKKIPLILSVITQLLLPTAYV